MRRNLFVMSMLAIALVTGRIVTSDDNSATFDQPPTLAPPEEPSQLSPDQLETISDVRSSNDVGFLRGEENDQLFLEALQSHAAQAGEFRDSAGLVPLEAAPAHADAASMLIESLLESATLLNERANEWERSEDHLAADQCRNLAQTLRLKVRSIKRDMQ